MTPLIPVLASAGPLMTGWTVHAAVLTRQLGISRRDPITGLRTRAAWTREAHRMAKPGGRAVLLLDLDKFKEVNDTCGHAAGDVVLTTAALRLRSWSDQTRGVCGRLGGDEFAVITRDFPASRDLDALAARLGSPVTLPDGRVVAIGASVGVAACSPAGLSAALGAADAAMYQAKQSGGGWRCADIVPDPNLVSRNRPRRAWIRPRVHAVKSELHHR